MSLKGNGIIGIRREDKNKWERRVPLAPEHVKILVDAGFRVLIQPSNIRVFPNDAYAEVGAEVTEDLSPAGLILAVKEVPTHLLIPNRTYMFFSHTIKAQPANMPLLDTLLEKNIRMIDYECITEGGLRGAKRMVAFGQFAGIAGMVDFLRGMGERFLSMGYSTPFLSIAAMYMYPNVAAAMAAVKACGDAIATYGLPADLSPFTAVFTGDGNVSKGAQLVFSQLPVKWVDPFQLGDVHRTAKGKDRTHFVYACIAKEQHMVRRKRRSAWATGFSATAGATTTTATTATSAAEGGGAVALVPVPTGACSSVGGGAASSSTTGGAPLTVTTTTTTSGGAAASSPPSSPASTPLGGVALGTVRPEDVEHDGDAFDKGHYKAHPDEYEPIFHAKIAPYMSVLINCMYWEPRFPRLLTIRQAQELKSGGRLPLLGVCDITCDFQGSVEFLKQFTSIEDPFYVYDVELDRVQTGDMDAQGVLYHAVDHLPSECPRDASDHFGKCLLPFIPAIARSDGTQPFPAQRADLPVEIHGAVICDHGELTPHFSYIAALRAAAVRAATTRGMRMARSESFLTVDLVGHLFDSGIINKMLDVVESASCSARIIDFHVGKDRSTPTELRMQVFTAGKHSDALAALMKEINALAASSGVRLSVDTHDSYMHEHQAAVARAVPKSIAAPMKRILVLGAGFVSAPLVEYLLRRPANHLTVASMIKAEAEALAFNKGRVTPVQLDVFREGEKLDALVGSHDLVVSLVPAPCHPDVARRAIAHHKHMVTASYISPEMKVLHDQAAAAGICILNEAGLDPGIDHMSAKRLIDDAIAAGGAITGFSSVCGGLPAPEAANNPLGYKFSWSPRGVLMATRNTAKYMRDGHTVEVPGEGLLASAVPFRVNPAYALECIPNRDSLPYAAKYGIESPHLKTMFRGTLRYAGFCAHMHALAALGLLGVEPRPIKRGATMRDLLAAAVAAIPASSSSGGDGGAGASATSASAPVDTSAFADDDALFAAAVDRASSAAHDIVAKLTTAAAALSPRLAALASAGAAACSNVSLKTDVLRQAEFRRFLEWAGLLDATRFAPLRGGDAGDGITGPKIEETLAAAGATSGGSASSASTTGSAASASGVLTFVPIDTMVAILVGKKEMALGPEERDMALMQHTLEAEFPASSSSSSTAASSAGASTGGRVRRVYTSTLVEYGNVVKGQTAMSRTVGFTAAIGAQLILDGRVTSVGVQAPITREWYMPMLDALEAEGIKMVETVTETPITATEL